MEELSQLFSTAVRRWQMAISRKIKTETEATWSLVEQSVKFGKKRYEPVCLRAPVELAHGLRAHAAALGKAVGGYCFADARQEDELQPLGERHGIHGKGLLEL